jgi:histidyl-tRNA synthetase
VRAALEEAPKIGDSLCEACHEHFAAVRGYLDALGVGYELVPQLVRGLDYYTRTTWEFVGPEHGAQSTISGGGRYDYLAEELGGPATPGVGFGAGIERLLLAVGEAGLPAPPQPAVEVFFVCDEGAPRTSVLALVARLRASGRACDADYAGRSLKGQLTHANRLGAKTIVIVAGETATIRTAGASDESIPLGELEGRLRA